MSEVSDMLSSISPTQWDALLAEFGEIKNSTLLSAVDEKAMQREWQSGYASAYVDVCRIIGDLKEYRNKAH